MFLLPEGLLQMNKWTGLDRHLLTAFPFGNKDGTAPNLCIFFKLLLRRCLFTSWLSSNESSVKWPKHTWTASTFYLFSSDLVFYDTKHFFQSWLIWITFTQQLGFMQPNFVTTVFNIGLSKKPPPRLRAKEIFSNSNL